MSDDTKLLTDCREYIKFWSRLTEPTLQPKLDLLVERLNKRLDEKDDEMQYGGGGCHKPPAGVLVIPKRGCSEDTDGDGNCYLHPQGCPEDQRLKAQLHEPVDCVECGKVCASKCPRCKQRVHHGYGTMGTGNCSGQHDARCKP